MAGIQRYVEEQKRKLTVNAIAKKAGLDASNLSKALKADSKQGLSRYQAEQVAKFFGKKGAVLFIESQGSVMKARIVAGSGEKAALLGLANALRSLKPKDLNDPEVKKLLAELMEETKDILAGGTAANGEPFGTAPSKLTPGTDASGFGVSRKSRRDAFGRKVPEGEPVTRDPFGRAIREA